MAVDDISRKTLFHFRQIGFGVFLEEDEEVIRAFRRPLIFTIVKMIFRFVFWGGIAGAIYFLYPNRLLYAWVAVSFFAIYKTIAAFCYWYFNAILMTNENIIFVEWGKLFKRKSTRIDYWNLDQIQVERTGVNSFFWNYGTLHFQKINGGELFSVNEVNRPNKTAKIIEAFREDMVDAKNFTEESSLKNLITGLVDRHVRDNGQPERNSRDNSLEPFERLLETKEPYIPQKNKDQEIEPHFDEISIEIEKKLDDDGGLGFDLDKNV